MKHRLALEMAVAFSLIVIIDLPRTWAVLGEPVSAVETDRVALAGQLSMIPAQLYTIQEITTSELVVREYRFFLVYLPDDLPFLPQHGPPGCGSSRAS